MGCGGIPRWESPRLLVGGYAHKYGPVAWYRRFGEYVWVGLDRVREPGNLGHIIRTIDAVGAKGDVLVGDCTDPFSLETVRATMGSIFSVPVAKASVEA